jgi:hypothetical protein
MITITIKTLEGKKDFLKVKKDMSIMALKEKIMLFINGKDPGQQKLIWNMTRLDDEKYLNDYEIEEGAIIHVVTPMFPCSCKKDMLGYCVKQCDC